MRVDICPHRATGLSGVMLTVDAPTCNTALYAATGANTARSPNTQHTIKAP